MTILRPDVIDVYKGNDIKTYDGLIEAGVKGLIHKASEGASIRDSMYAYRRRAQNGRFLFGAYHFNSRTSKIEDQVANFLAVAEPDKDTLLAADWEGDRTAWTVDECRKFLELLCEKTGREPHQIWLYGGNIPRERIKTNADKAFFGMFRNWHCQYQTNSPRVSDAWKTWELWQYDDQNALVLEDGTEVTGGKCDFNVYNGSLEQMIQNWAPHVELVPKAAPPKKAAPVEPTPEPAKPQKSKVRKAWDWFVTH